MADNDWMDGFLCLKCVAVLYIPVQKNERLLACSSGVVNDADQRESHRQQCWWSDRDASWHALLHLCLVAWKEKNLRTLLCTIQRTSSALFPFRSQASGHFSLASPLPGVPGMIRYIIMSLNVSSVAVPQPSTTLIHILCNDIYSSFGSPTHNICLRSR